MFLVVFGAANLQKTDLIIRICSDNPFIDATEVDYLIRKFKSKNMIIHVIIKTDLIVIM